MNQIVLTSHTKKALILAACAAFFLWATIDFPAVSGKTFPCEFIPYTEWYTMDGPLSDVLKDINAFTSRFDSITKLRVIADWYTIGLQSNRQVLVSWSPSIECNASLTDLVENMSDKVKLLPFTLTSDSEKNRQFIEDITIESNKTFIYIPNQDIHFMLPRHYVMSEVDVVMSSYEGLITLQHTPCQYYMYKRSEFYQSLVPTNDIQQVVTQIKSQYFQDTLMIGIHIRTHDVLFDWAIVPPMETANAKKFGEGATLEIFQQYMNMIDQQFHIPSSSSSSSSNINQNTNNIDDTSINTGDTNSSNNTSENNNKIKYYKFFIASNDHLTKMKLLEQYPDAVIINGEYSRMNSNGIKIAFIEWLLLSEASLLINTYSSSFAVEASYRYMRPLLGVWEGHLLHHDDIRLPYCGQNQYLAHLSKFTTKSQFVEGTHDNRVIDAKVIKLGVTDRFHQWGLLEVYCAQHE